MNEIKVPHSWLKPKKGMHTPWGSADSLSAICPDGSVIQVGTSGHGGIGVHVGTHTVPEHFKKLAICGDTWAWFEEDCAWAAAALMLPEVFPDQQDMAAKTLCNWYPDAYAAHFGRVPSAAESMEVRSRELKERLKNCFTVNAAWGDWAWDVPAGSVYVLGARRSDCAEAGFLVPKADYKSPVDEIVLDAYPRWEPNKSLPYTKPKPMACQTATS